jgi:hypothetical protein
MHVISFLSYNHCFVTIKTKIFMSKMICMSIKYSFVVFLGGHTCPNLNECNQTCEYGRLRSLSGCELCECINPCENIKCLENHECVVENSIGICKRSKKKNFNKFFR